MRMAPSCLGASPSPPSRARSSWCRHRRLAVRALAREPATLAYRAVIGGPVSHRSAATPGTSTGPVVEEPRRVAIAQPVPQRARSPRPLPHGAGRGARAVRNWRDRRTRRSSSAASAAPRRAGSEARALLLYVRRCWSPPPAGVVAGAMLQVRDGIRLRAVAAPLLFAAIALTGRRSCSRVGAGGQRADARDRAPTAAAVGAPPRCSRGRCRAMLSAWRAARAAAGGAAGGGDARRVARWRRGGSRRRTCRRGRWGSRRGALTTSTSTSGPPLLLHLLGRGATAGAVRDTRRPCLHRAGVRRAARCSAPGIPRCRPILDARRRRPALSPTWSAARVRTCSWPAGTTSRS